MGDDHTLSVRARGSAPWRLSARSPTLGGNIPLRAAQACTPFLRGNAFGWQLSPPRPLRVQRSWGGLSVTPTPASARALDRHTLELTFDTGLTLSPVEGFVPVLERAYNRRDQRVSVPERALPQGGALHVTLLVALSRDEGEAELSGELASLALFPEAPRSALVPLSAAPDVGRAHLAFFDAKYFDDKRSGPTRRYRSQAGRDEGPPAPRADALVEVIHAGGALPSVTRGPSGVLEVTLPAEVATRLAFHGLRVEAHPEPRALALRAEDIARTWGAVFGAEASPERGAIRYFTTYVTPHTAGDPHLFFKPATLLRAPPGWGAVIDGPAVKGHAVLRGVTEARWFHAVPAVVQLDAVSSRVRVGETLVRARPIPLVDWALDGP